MGNIVVALKKRFSELRQRWNQYIQNNFGKTQKSVYWLSTILMSILLGVNYSDFGLPRILGFLIAGLISFFCITIVYGVINWLTYLFFRIRINNIVYSGTLLFIFTFLIAGTSYGYLPTAFVLLSAGISIVVLQLFVRSVWALIKNKVKTKTVISTLCITGLLIFLGCVFLLSDGFNDTYIEEYRQLDQINQSGKYSFEQGNNQPASMEYGVSDRSEIQSTTFDITPFIDGYKGLQGAYRKIYQGYDFTEVPLSGKVWYPTDQQDCPVLFIVHGNHNFIEPSYLGYDYLGEYLAGNGYVVVSVNQNALNGCVFGNLTEENDARAILLLENIRQVETYNGDSSSPLYQKIDFEKIAIAGHSRGGEMAAAAALFNDAAYYPENGNIKFDYHYTIRSVIAIAPSVDQYKPADHDTKLKDIHYLLLQGANDQDAAVFMGSKQYNNVSFSGDGYYFKSSLYIAGANHGQFNTYWGKYDAPSPVKAFLNVKNLMDAEQQRSVAKLFIHAFLEETLKNEYKDRELFRNIQKYAQYIPKTLYIQRYQDSTFECIADFEEDSNIESAANTEASLYASDMKTWKEEIIRYVYPAGERTRANYGVRLAWENTTKSKYRMDFAPRDVAMKNVQFDIVDMDDTRVQEKRYKKIDARIMLIDVDGHKASAQISDHCTVYPPWPVKLGKLQFIFNTSGYKHEMQTVLIPAESFVSAENAFDYSNVCGIQFVFDKADTGDIILDNIGFSMR